MKSLLRHIPACCLLSLFLFTASTLPAQDTPSAPSTTQSRIEAEGQSAAQAASAGINASTDTDTHASAVISAGTSSDSSTNSHGSAATKAKAPTAAKLAASGSEHSAADGSAVAAGEAALEGDPAEGTSMQSDPLMIILLTAAAAYVFHLWRQDYLANRAGTPNKGAFPGATPATAKAVVVAVVGSLILLAVETGGEIVLGISAEQSSMTVLMLLSITAAAFFEELIFRGYLVISDKGRSLLIGSIVGFSVLFALIHPFLWDITTPEGVPGWQIWNADWQFHFDSTKAWFSTCFVLVNSLWFYAMRFTPLNPARSLIPCIAAHLAMNWGVFIIKLAQGHVTGL